MFRFVETIRVNEGHIENLEYHQWRLDRTFKNFYPNHISFRLEKLLFVPEKYSKGLVKLRFLYNQLEYKLEFFHYKLRRINCLKLVNCDYIEYSYKYLSRSIFRRLLEQADNCEEILIVKQGFITDTSFSNIIFFNGRQWITPATPLLKGTMRQRLLEEGRIISQKIRPSDIEKFSYFKLINALLEWDFPIMSVKKIVR